MFIVEYKYIKLQSKMQNVASAFYTKLQTSWNELHFRLHGTQVEVTTINANFSYFVILKRQRYSVFGINTGFSAYFYCKCADFLLY